MIGLLRAGVGLLLIAITVWCAFRVPLGRRTFAEHADRIGETPEARELVESTRGAISPMLEDATQRMLGEHIEAPTGPTSTIPSSAAASSRPTSSAPASSAAAASRPASSAPASSITPARTSALRNKARDTIAR